MLLLLECCIYRWYAVLVLLILVPQPTIAYKITCTYAVSACPVLQVSLR
jgi:hypothetical protein